jgi:predicted nucleic acid-binding Zn ribbon protein
MARKVALITPKDSEGPMREYRGQGRDAGPRHGPRPGRPKPWSPPAMAAQAELSRRALEKLKGGRRATTVRFTPP